MIEPFKKGSPITLIPNKLDFDKYQHEARKTAVYPSIGNNLWYPALGLCGEASEVAEKVKKIYRDHSGAVSAEAKANLCKELGDILWYVASEASELGISLGIIAEQNIRKLADRAKRDKVHGEGDKR